MNDEQWKVSQVLLKINIKKVIEKIYLREELAPFELLRTLYMEDGSVDKKCTKYCWVLNWFPTQIPNGNSSSIHTVKCRNIQLTNNLWLTALHVKMNSKTISTSKNLPCISHSLDIVCLGLGWYNQTPWLASLNHKHLFLIILETTKFDISVLIWSNSDERTFLACRCLPSCTLTWLGWGEREVLWSSFKKALTRLWGSYPPLNLIVSQRPHVLISCWELGPQHENFGKT